MKKLVSLILTVLLLVPAVAVFAEEIPAEDISLFATASSYTYEVEDGKAIVTGAPSGTITVTIPATISGYPITAVAADAFAENTEIKTVDLSSASNLLTVGDNAFSYCSELTTFRFPSSSAITTIGNNVLYYCPKLATVANAASQNALTEVGASVLAMTPYLKSQAAGFVMLGKVLLKYTGSDLNITIPAGTVAIADAFFGQKITSVTFNAGLKTIGNNAFYNCKSLTTVNLPATVEKIGDMAFSNCAALTNVSFGASLASVGFCAFANCKLLASFSCTGESAINEVSECAFWNCSALASADFGAIEIVNVGTFWNCFDGSNMVIYRVPRSVTTILEGGYGNLSGFSFITVPDTVTSIDTSAFGEIDEDAYYVTPKGSVVDTYFQNIASGMTYENFVNYGDVDLDQAISADDIRDIATRIADDNTNVSQTGDNLVGDINDDYELTLRDINGIMKTIKDSSNG